MGETIRLRSPFDGFTFTAYRAAPDDARRGGLVLIQEIFGVTAHIRELADGFAAEGYEVIAPSLYDRLSPEFCVAADAQGVKVGREYSQATPWNQVADDLAACVTALRPPVFVAGYCWGGTAAWLAACRCGGVSAVSSFYGRRIPELVSETPACPTILHFGRQDASIPPAVVNAIGEAHPDIPIYVYEAGHGFVSDRSADYNPDAARLATLRTLQLFARGAGRAEM